MQAVHSDFQRPVSKLTMSFYTCKIVILLMATAPFVSRPYPARAQQPVASFYYDEQGKVVRQERDTNGDGRMDRWTYYDPQGQVERSRTLTSTASRMYFSTMRRASHGGRRPQARTTAESIPGFILTLAAKSSVKEKTPRDQANRQSGCTIRKASPFAPKRTLIPAVDITA